MAEPTTLTKPMTLRAFVAGPASWNTLVYLDRLPDPRPQTVFAQRHVQTLGGTSAGKSLHLAALGADVTLRTVIGADAAGDEIRDRLRDSGVDLSAECADGPSEQHLNLMNPRGERISIFLELPTPRPEQQSAARTGAARTAASRTAAARTAASRTDAALAACDVAVLDLAEHVRPLLTAARGLGKTICCDVHDYDGHASYHTDFVAAADLLFLSDDAMADPLPFMHRAHAGGARVVVCTRGAAGAVALTRDGVVHVPAEPVTDIVDTNGAGDAFIAGFLVRHLAGGTVHEAMLAGHRQAAMALRSPHLAPPQARRPDRRTSGS